MFARRSHKHDDDEEPLVPHGLIWQATGESSDAEQELAKPATLEDNQVSPQVVEMPANASPQPQADTPRKLGAISPPLQWPSPKIQEIARHPNLRVAQPPAVPIDEQRDKKASPQPVNVPAAAFCAVAAHPPTPNLILVARTRTASWVKVGYGRVRSAVLSGGSWARTVSADALRAIAAFITGLHDRVHRVDVKGRFVNARDLAGTRVRSWQQKSQSLGTAAARNLKEWRQAAALRSRSGIQNSVATVKAINFGAPARSWQRARNFKVTVRIPYQDLAGIVAAISAMKAPWNRARQAANRDSRLWTSMTMAGLSALLAHGFVSALTRYQPNGSPDVVAAAHSPDMAASIKPAELTSVPPVVSKVAASPRVQRPSPAVRPQRDAAAKRTVMATSKLAKPAAMRPASSKRPDRKTRISDDDDYVAKDTYVLYGSNGKPLRH